MALRYVGMERRDLAYWQLSDLELANAVFLANRNDLSLIHYQEAAKQRIRWLSAQLAALLPDERDALLQDAWGALNFILAFYEPDQRYLDTEAWKTCEAGARDVHKRLAQAIEARRAATAKTGAVEDESAVAESDAPNTSQGPNP